MRQYMYNTFHVGDVLKFSIISTVAINLLFCGYEVRNYGEINL